MKAIILILLTIILHSCGTKNESPETKVEINYNDSPHTIPHQQEKYPTLIVAPPIDSMLDLMRPSLENQQLLPPPLPETFDITPEPEYIPTSHLDETKTMPKEKGPLLPPDTTINNEPILFAFIYSGKKENNFGAGGLSKEEENKFFEALKHNYRLRKKAFKVLLQEYCD